MLRNATIAITLGAFVLAFPCAVQAGESDEASQWTVAQTWRRPVGATTVVASTGLAFASGLLFNKNRAVFGVSGVLAYGAGLWGTANLLQPERDEAWKAVYASSLLGLGAFAAGFALRSDETDCSGGLAPGAPCIDQVRNRDAATEMMIGATAATIGSAWILFMALRDRSGADSIALMPSLNGLSIAGAF